MTEIRCPRCGGDDFVIDSTFPALPTDEILDCECRKCHRQWRSRALDAPPVTVQGRENGYYWVRLNDVDDAGWEIAEWDGRVWARIADDAPVDETEVAKVGPMVPAYRG
jgi:hypothetical protein